MARLPDIQLPAHLKERLAQGHPWVYRTHVPPEVRLPAGSWVRVRCGTWTGYGLWDASGPIALRIFSQRQAPDARWLRERVRAAWELRLPLRAAGITAYRWLFGEGDGLPGLTVDLYGAFAVVQTSMDGATVLLDWLIDALRTLAPVRGILLKAHGPEMGDQEEAALRPPLDARPPNPARHVSVIWGEAPPRDLVVVEHGLAFYADLYVGQKTGLFLDQRENRHFIERVSAERTVLNCFAYTGGFALYALRGGASEVVSADIGRGLAEAAAANIALNGLNAAWHTFVVGDCFDLLARYAGEGRRFDLVILDPPSFASSPPGATQRMARVFSLV